MARFLICTRSDELPISTMGRSVIVKQQIAVECEEQGIDSSSARERLRSARLMHSVLYATPDQVVRRQRIGRMSLRVQTMQISEMMTSLLS